MPPGEEHFHTAAHIPNGGPGPRAPTPHTQRQSQLTSDTNLTAASINVSEKRWEIGRNADSSIDKSDFIKDGNSTLKDTV